MNNDATLDSIFAAKTACYIAGWGIRMYNVMIVEDEMLVRLGLKHSVDWGKFGMQVVADLANGAEAWDQFQRAAPDVLITDLKMPIMGGMELIGKIRSVNPTTRIVILTCLEEFHLAREAVTLDVSGYLVKLSMSTEEMEAVLVKLREELAKQPSHAELPLPDEASAKESLLKDFLFLQRYTSGEFARKAVGMKLSLSARRLMICAMELDPYERLQEKFKDSRGSLIRLSLLNVLEEVLKSYDCCEVFHDSDNRYVLIFSFAELSGEREAEEVLGRIVGHVRKVMSVYFDITATFGASGKQDGYDKLKLLYEESRKALNRSFVGGLGRMYVHSERQSEALTAETADKLQRVAAIWEGTGLPYSLVCKGVLERYLKAYSSCERKDLLVLFARLLHGPIVTLRLADDEISERCTFYAAELSKARTLDALIGRYEEFVQELLRKLRRRKQTSPAIASVLRFVEEKYADSITLQEAAENVLMNANYLSTLFKKEMDMNFVDYVMRFRIEKAKELFLTGGLRAYEVGERIGFASHSHFSRVFKRYAGLSIREFRRGWTDDSAEDAEDEE
ncbi:response regulator transcription factor [Paenibacillus sp. strain BS8-2]